MPYRSLMLLCVLVLAVGIRSESASGAMWCAQPIEVHEWGVMVFDAHGKALSGLVPLPSWIYNRATPGGAPAAGLTPVRTLPADGGERALPILQIYLPKSDWAVWNDNIPLGLEVGFTQGVATAWFPSIDGLRSSNEANSPGAQAARQILLEQRAKRTPFSYPSPTDILPSDPTRQLIWESLLLTQAPLHTAHPPEVPWVEDMRATEGALWVNGASESERFVFYEGRSVEVPALAFETAGSACALKNLSAYPVHDVFAVYRDASGAVSVGYMPTLNAGASWAAGEALFDQHPADAKTLDKITRTKLHRQLTELPPAPPPPDPKTPPSPMDGCVMGRDPALPTEAATHHALSSAEADALIKAWGVQMFDQPGVTLVYREDIAYLDAIMPLSIYTDMMHFTKSLHRTGIVVQQGLTPDASCLK